MAKTDKTRASKKARSPAPTSLGASASVTSAHSTVAGPAFDTAAPKEKDLLLEKMRGTQRLVAAMPANPASDH